MSSSSDQHDRSSKLESILREPSSGHPSDDDEEDDADFDDDEGSATSEGGAKSHGTCRACHVEAKRAPESARDEADVKDGDAGDGDANRDADDGDAARSRSMRRPQ